MNLFYPEIAVHLGSYRITKGVSVTVSSAQDSYYDWAKIRFTPAFTEALSLAKDSPAEIFMGYEDGMQSVFKGVVSKDFVLSDNLNEVLLQDESIKLSRTMINKVFLSAQPSEVVAYCCQQAGINNIKLDAKQYPQKTYGVMGETALKAIKGIDPFWGIKSKLYMQGGVFCWTPPLEQTQIYIFEYAKNIIKLTKEGGVWVLETVAVPMIKHSDNIGIKHPQITGTYGVHKVEFGTNSEGFLRSKLYFRG